MSDYQTIVIGAGPAGTAVAYPLAAKQRVLVIERDLFGGTCPNRGCDPKKMLYSAIETKLQANHMQGFGLSGEPQINWPDLMAFKRAYTSQIPVGTQRGLTSAGITTIRDAPTFIDAHTLQIAGEKVTTDNIVIATGQTPRALDIPGHQWAKTSTDFLDLDQLPNRITFIGGGYISFELANIAAVAGAKVTLIHHNDRPLKAFPQDLVDALINQMTAIGIDVKLETTPTEIQQSSGHFTVQTSNDAIESDLVINATGRIPNLADLNLSDIGVLTDEHGIQVSDHLKTTVDNVYAIGDVVSRREPKLTPVAGFEGAYVAQSILGSTTAPIHYPVIPTIVFGTEKLAQVGVSVNTALAQPDAYTVEHLDVTHWYTYNRIKDPTAQALVVKDAAHNVVGIASLSSVADELINTFVDQLTPTGSPIYAYPTPASDLSYFD